MNLQELKTFLTIVETGSLVKTSDLLNVTQSTVTARLKSLEQEVGQTLINRNKSGATMTAAGMRLHRYADTISNLWRQARQETALPHGMSGVCNLACEIDLWRNMGEHFFKSLQREYPEIAISVWLGSQGDVASWLSDGRSDIAFTYLSRTSHHQDQIELQADKLVLVSTERKTPLKFNPDYIFVEAGEAFGREHAEAFADAGTARINFGNAVLGLEYLLGNGGNAYLPQRIAKAAIEKGVLQVVAEAPVFHRPVYLNFNKTARRSWHWFDHLLAGEMTSVTTAPKEHA